jgi:hypothetical protein
MKMEDQASFDEVKSLYDRIIEITSELSLLTVVCLVMVGFLVLYPKGKKKNGCG